MVYEKQKTLFKKKWEKYRNSINTLKKNRSIYEINLINLYFYFQNKRINHQNYIYYLKKQKEKLELYKKRITNDYNDTIKKLDQDYIDELEYEIDRDLIVSRLSNETFKNDQNNQSFIEKFIRENSQDQDQVDNVDNVDKDSQDQFNSVNNEDNIDEDIFDTTKW